MFSPKLGDRSLISDQCLACGEHLHHTLASHVGKELRCIIDGCQCDGYRPPARGPRFDDFTPDQAAMVAKFRELHA
jgi:hypothetical protein